MFQPSRDRNSIGEIGETNHPRSLFLWRGDDDDDNGNDTNIKVNIEEILLITVRF